VTNLLARAESELMAAVRAATSHVRLASPFLSIRIARELAAAATTSAAEWSFVTRLDAAAAAGGFLSTDGLRQLLDAGVLIRHSPRLHAKVYLADSEFALVGSANLTSSGLGASASPNVELSVRLSGDDVEHAHAVFTGWWRDSSPVTRDSVIDLDRAARDLPRAVAVQVGLASGDTPENVGILAALMGDARSTNLWVKAQYGMPNYEQWRSEFWFSSSARGRPSFTPGDLVLIYAKEAHACYAIVQVVDEPRHDPKYVVERGGRPIEEAERWPWVNRTIPRFVPVDNRLVRPIDLGFTGQGLQGGHRRIALPEFVAAIRALAGESDPY